MSQLRSAQFGQRMDSRPSRKRSYGFSTWPISSAENRRESWKSSPSSNQTPVTKCILPSAVLLTATPSRPDLSAGKRTESDGNNDQVQSAPQISTGIYSGDWESGNNTKCFNSFPPNACKGKPLKW